MRNLRHRNKKFESNFSANNAAQDAGYRKLESSKRCWPLSDYANRIKAKILPRKTSGWIGREFRERRVVLEYEPKLVDLVISDESARGKRALEAKVRL